jgi:hypothetical protein
MLITRSVALFLAAAVLEIGGAWLVWQGVREHRGWLWIGLGVVALGVGRAQALCAIRAAGDGVLEFAHAAPEGTPRVGQPLRAEDEQGEHEDDDEFCGTDAWHASTVMFGGPALVKRW